MTCRCCDEALFFLKVGKGSLVVVGEDESSFDLAPFQALFCEEFFDHVWDVGGAEDAADSRFFAIFFDVGDVHAELVDGVDGGLAAFDFDDDGGVVFVEAVEVDGSCFDWFFSFDDAESWFDEIWVFDYVVDDVAFHACDVEGGFVSEAGDGEVFDVAEGDLHFLWWFGVSAAEDEVAVLGGEGGGASGGLPVDGVALGGLVDEEGAVLFEEDEAFAPVEEGSGAAVVVDEAVAEDEEHGVV